MAVSDDTAVNNILSCCSQGKRKKFYIVHIWGGSRATPKAQRKRLSTLKVFSLHSTGPLVNYVSILGYLDGQKRAILLIFSTK